jgi:hypothetical protein
MLIYYAFNTRINILRGSLLKKIASYPLGSFKDISVHRDRQREATLFYTMMIQFFFEISDVM